MPLPKIQLPTYQIQLPVSKQKVTFRAYTVREEKILLIAKEDSDSSQVELALNQIIANCSDIKDPGNLCEADRNYVLVQFRSKLNGNIEHTTYICKHDVNGEECNNPLEVDINLDEIGLVEELRPSTFKLTPTSGIKFHVPTVNEFRSINSKEYQYSIDKDITTMFESLESTFDKESITLKEDTTFKEFEEWVLDLPTEQYEKIEEFFDHLPRLSYDTSVKCSKCGTEHKIHIEGLESFFSS